MKKCCYLLMFLLAPLTLFATTSKMSTNSFFQASNYLYTSHHHGLIPRQFVGTYDYLHKKLHDQFTIDEQGHVQGHFRRTGVLIDWKASVVSIGRDPLGNQRLQLFYVISREQFKKLSKAVTLTMDTPGVMYITPLKTSSKHAYSSVDIIGHFGNFLGLNLKFKFTADNDAPQIEK